MTESHPVDSAERIELIREAVTMALYIGLSLLAVLVAIPTSAAEQNEELPWLVLWTTIGLIFAHQVAFRLSTRLVSRGRFEGMAPALLGAQLVGGAVAGAIAVVPLLIFGAGALVLVEGLLLAMVAIVGYLAARSAPVSRWRALGYVAGVIVIVILVLGVKSLAGH